MKDLLWEDYTRFGQGEEAYFLELGLGLQEGKKHMYTHKKAQKQDH